MRKRIVWIVLILLGLFVAVAGGGAWWSWSLVRGSLAQLDGDVILSGIEKPVEIERDALGIPVIRGKNRRDVAFASGFVHAQERFFQMDLLRRNAAGELAELIGPPVLEKDQEVRVHRFRHRAERVVAAGDEWHKNLLQAYSDGVNAGLRLLSRKPFEYYFLGTEPVPWRPEDSVLVVYSMFLDLHDTQAPIESTRGVLFDVLPTALAEFLAPRGCEWDAPIEGADFEVPPIPGPEVFDLRKAATSAAPAAAAAALWTDEPLSHPGSNNWAVAGSHTKTGAAIVANDMHLGISVPHIWYRASLEWPDEQDDKKLHRMTGPMLPGTPAVVVGSNGHVAWGFTNSEGDWSDLIVLELDPDDAQRYLTPEGYKSFEVAREIIHVKGADEVELEVKETIWGPVIDQDHRGRPRVMRWTAHDVEGVNLGLMRLEQAQSLEEALNLAAECGSPQQNFTVGDREGHIAWTILGKIPRRTGFDGFLPSSWADGSHAWDRYYAAIEYPRVIDPPGGRIWTANSRVVSDAKYDVVGHGGYDLGARSSQIRDGLMAIDKATEADMLKVQLDDRALFLERYQKLLLEALDESAVSENAQRKEARGYVENWGGRAAIDSIGYTIVRRFNHHLAHQVLESITASCKTADERFNVFRIEAHEGALWKLLGERPLHLLDPKHKDWRSQFLSACDAALIDLTQNGARLADQNWGKHNTTAIQHPLSQAVPSLASWLDMPALPLPGDRADLPRIQAPRSGASQRMAVSPGREAEGYFHMPCGQSGHPLSPYYRAGHEAWCNGVATPFLPGKAEHRLVLQ